MAKLPKTLQKGPFTYQQALAAGLNLRSVRQLVANEQCFPIFKGVYMPSGVDYDQENQFKAATLIVGEPSAVCLLSALFFYNLTDIIPKKTWVLVPATKRSNFKGLKLLRQSDPQWDVGIKKADGYSITTIERTIVESFCYRTMLGSSIAIPALRKATKEKMTTLSKVLDMAKKMEVVHRILPYIEALS